MSARRIILSRTDSIGDVILTLPMAGVIKQKYPESHIIFLGKSYTAPVIRTSKYVDEFLDWDELQLAEDPVERLKAIQADTFIHVFPNKTIARLAKKAGIRNRIGTSGRLYHMLTSNQKVFFTRKRSDLHEAQLNLKLLSPLGINRAFHVEEIPNFYGLEKITPLEKGLEALLSRDKINVILHPKSKGSAKEWGIANFNRLIQILPEDQYHIFITGTEDEGKLLENKLMLDAPHVTSLLGKLSLTELISFIAHADAMVAASTGPLHIAAALGIKAIGLFSNRRPIHPGRWKPIGKSAHALVNDSNCTDCSKGKNCDCIQEIAPERVKALLT